MKYAEILKQLTLEEKAALMSGRDFWSTTAYEKCGIPSMFLSDGPHGIRKQAAASDHLGLNASIPATCFPTAAAMANTWNVELGEELGKRLGEEATAQRVNVLLGPGMNIKRSPLCGRDFEYFSEDPYLAGKMAASYVRGIQSYGISGCLKHFAANNQEERRMVIDSVVDERTLREIYLTGFEIAIEEGKPHTIMSSYNKLNGTHTNENMHLMRDILRGEWGYEGVVVTDWAGCNDRVEGVKAGNELEMPCCLYGNDDIIKAVNEGRLSMEEVDECLDRLLDLIFSTSAALKDKPTEFNVEEHHAFAYKCASESMVLLKNEDAALPLAEKERICVIGDFAQKPRYQGAGSSIVNPTKLDNAIDCIKGYPLDYVGYEPGYDRYGKRSKKKLNAAIALAKKSDTIVYFIGLDEVSEAEGIDRRDMKLPQNQLDVLAELLKLKKKIVAVLVGGSAVEFGCLANCNAVLYASLGGQAGARAVLDALTGKINPSGKLSESFAFALEDYASSSRFPGKAMSVEYREGLYVGYRYFTTANVPVRYPFGYGLSYTTFEYSDLQVSKDGVTFTIKNTGERDGAEIAQLYIGKKDAEVFRPAIELKGFAKVFLKAGESKQITIPFDKRTFRYFNVATNKWEIEGGAYEVYIGASSEDMRLTGSVEVEGTNAPVPYEKELLPSYYSGKANDVHKAEFTKLLGRPIPRAGYTFYKKRRMVIHENCTVADLRFSKRWVGRLFSGAMRFAHAFLWKIGNRTLANTIMMGVIHQPIRGLAKFGGMSRRQMEAMLMMFNGHLFKGVFRFFTKEKVKKTEEKAKEGDK